jgi:hypothetical protein
MHRQKPTHKAGVSLEPSSHLLALMHTRVIEDHRDATNGRWNLPIQLGEQGDELFLPLAHLRSSVDLPRTGIEGGKQMQGPCSFVAMLQARRVAWSSGKGGGPTRTRLQIGLLVGTHHHLFISQWTRVKMNQVAHLLSKVLITGNVRAIRQR